MCRVLSVSRSGYYRWRGRPESRRTIANRRLDMHIKVIYKKFKGRYGSPKITDELNDMGITVSKNRVARRMKAAGLRSIIRRKYRCTTDSKPIRFKSKDMNEGRHDWNDNGVNPDVHHAGGVPVVVRGRESLLHGEGEQFKCLKCKLSGQIR